MNDNFLTRIRRRVIHRFYGIANNSIFGAPKDEGDAGKKDDPEAQKKATGQSCQKYKTANYSLVARDWGGVCVARAARDLGPAARSLDSVIHCIANFSESS